MRPIRIYFFPMSLTRFSFVTAEKHLNKYEVIILKNEWGRWILFLNILELLSSCSLKNLAKIFEDLFNIEKNVVKVFIIWDSLLSNDKICPWCHDDPSHFRKCYVGAVTTYFIRTDPNLDIAEFANSFNNICHWTILSFK